jgi:hypothetical protein
MLRARLQSLPYELASLISEHVGVHDHQKQLERKIFHNIRMLEPLFAIRALFKDCETSGAVDYANPVLFSFGGSNHSDSFPYIIEKIIDVVNDQPVETRFLDKYYYQSHETGHIHEEYENISYGLSEFPLTEFTFYENGFSRTALYRVYHVMCRCAYSQNDTGNDTFRAAIIRDSHFADPPEFTVVNTWWDV